MDELEISGKRYISTKRAGKDHKYHADYIGQLIRAKKVEGQKVGRSWYVDADSLAAYLGTEAAPRPADAPVARIPATVVEEAVEAPEPVEAEQLDAVQIEEVEESPVVAQSIEEDADNADEQLVDEEVVSHTSAKVEPVFYRTTKEAREARGGLRYIADEGPLLPPIKKNTVQYQAPAAERFEEETPITIKIVEERVERAAPIQVHTETYVAAAKPTPKRPHASKGGFGLFAARAGVVLLLGAVVFGVAAFASTHLIFTQTLDGGQSASAGYSVK